jgi:seryl-tRNA synthetase
LIWQRPFKLPHSLLYLQPLYVTMLQIQFIRQNAELVKQKLAIKNFANIGWVDELIADDEKLRQLKASTENAQALINNASKEIGALMANGKKEDAEQKKAVVNTLKQNMQSEKELLESIEKSFTEKLLLLPNLPSDAVPAGKTAEDNEVTFIVDRLPALPENAKPHWEIIKDLDIVNFETGAKITGSGFPLFKGQGAKLQRSLVQYFLDYNTAAGYTEFTPPLLVNEQTAYGTGQLPDKEGQMYFVTEDKLYLIPTSEVPVTNIYAGEIIKETELPIKMTAFSQCFRREAGSFGSDVRGLNRVHQFEKVEIIQLTKAEESYITLDAMVKHVEGLLQSLELPYRILKLCGGDMSFASALTYDFEVYSAAQQKWLEVSSVSNFENFQTNRMKIRYKDAEGKTQLLHSLNGSSLALPRIIACLLENNQQADGSILLPKILHSYFGKTIIQ